MKYNNIAIQILYCIKHIEVYGWKNILTKIDFYIDKKSYELMIKLLEKHDINDKEIKLLSFCILSGYDDKDGELKSLFTACCLYDLLENNGKFTFTDNDIGFVKESALNIYNKLDKNDVERIKNELSRKLSDDSNPIEILKRRLKKHNIFKYLCL